MNEVSLRGRGVSSRSEDRSATGQMGENSLPPDTRSAVPEAQDHTGRRRVTAFLL